MKKSFESAVNVTGFPASHCRGIQRYVDQRKYVILSRSVGNSATGLIEEGYCTKGFRIHTKSCDFGPMAGFVCLDPRFSKRGAAGMQYNSNESKVALYDVNLAGWNALSLPIVISEKRRKALLTMGKIGIGAETLEKQGDRWLGVTKSAGMTIPWYLLPEKPDSVSGMPLWGIHFDKNTAFTQMRLGQPKVVDDASGMEKMLGLVNPGTGGIGYKAVVTGDYDLFAIWVSSGDYQPDSMDKRMIDPNKLTANAKELEDRIKSGQPVGNYHIGEDLRRGNTTSRVNMVAGDLNASIKAESGYPHIIVHHSDEGGRPFVSDVDLPLIGFIPQGAEPYVIENIGDLREFINLLSNRYAQVFNPGWMKQLITGSANRGINTQQLQDKKTGLRHVPASHHI